MLPSVLRPGADPLEAGPPGKFGDLAVPALLEMMEAQGAKRSRIVARLVGGANMFSFPGSREAQPPLGERNLTAVREAQREAGISGAAEDSGGTKGRSLELAPADGSLAVWTAFQEVRWL